MIKKMQYLLDLDLLPVCLSDTGVNRRLRLLNLSGLHDSACLFEHQRQEGHIASDEQTTAEVLHGKTRVLLSGLFLTKLICGV